jgi:hypothetical protein
LYYGKGGEGAEKRKRERAGGKERGGGGREKEIRDGKLTKKGMGD